MTIRGRRIVAPLFVSIVVTLLALLAVDRLLSPFASPANNLVFPRYARVRYDTPEFRVEVRINNLGFRGDNVAIRSPTRYRVLALGDSFTLGWGVDVRDSWPRVLEKRLRARGLDVDVLNLGAPGTYPTQYAAIADVAIPLLRPNLVIVAVDHGDDLAQTIAAARASDAQPPGRRAWNAVKAGVEWTYPNLIVLRRTASARLAGEMVATANWKQQVAGFLSGSSAEERARFDRLDEPLRKVFIDGGVNPGLLFEALRRPDEIQRTLEVDSAPVQRGIRDMAGHLAQIRRRAEAVGGKVIVVALPNGFFVSETTLGTYARMGYVVNPGDFLTTTRMDAAVRTAAISAGIGAFEVTRRFREESRKRELFYTLDGHYNAEGQRFFAQCIEAAVWGNLGAGLDARGGGHGAP